MFDVVEAVGVVVVNASWKNTDGLRPGGRESTGGRPLPTPGDQFTITLSCGAVVVSIKLDSRRCFSTLRWVAGRSGVEWSVERGDDEVCCKERSPSAESKPSRLVSRAADPMRRSLAPSSNKL